MAGPAWGLVVGRCEPGEDIVEDVMAEKERPTIALATYTDHRMGPCERQSSGGLGYTGMCAVLWCTV